jgi:mRNA interferase MazF
VVDENSVRRGDVYVVDLRPTPCVVVSPDELNERLRTFIVAPLTSGRHDYPFRVGCKFQGQSGHVVLDQIRTVDRQRLVRRVGKLSDATMIKALAILQEMFSP